jgi:hypothetical protein
MAFVRDPNCLTPIMTSNTTPSGTATNDTSTTPYLLYDGDTTTQIYISGVAHWYTYAFSTPKKVDYYNIYGGDNPSAKSWTMQG